jgi:hypothetical protein
MKMVYIREMFTGRKLAFCSPRLWDDPFENIVSTCQVVDKSTKPWTVTILGSQRRSIWGQCWSLAVESDALWRIYSAVRKDPVTGQNEALDDEGLKIRTSPAKVMHVLQSAPDMKGVEAAFIGVVRYLPEEVALQNIANEVGRSKTLAYSTPEGHAASLLVKRDAFKHEYEVRVVLVGAASSESTAKVVKVDIDPNVLIEEIILDPRLTMGDVSRRTSDSGRLATRVLLANRGSTNVSSRRLSLTRLTLRPVKGSVVRLPSGATFGDSERNCRRVELTL